ncbi:2OG-Fe(II) oxygenase family protein [Colwellia sp. BRX10-3]|uniref:2OG-Fe(II) oxygenase family protein n=1 Tax=Colwellia sp. BRX10-3 TaxID=2759844 RepID=UPI0015F5A43B|nr:2OG-Fe(II) oxygenase family protein [Colwellia sp. BRX10-3]MBA6390565.1 2OG-Fe(II) oxygenase family protein [Colwellia sp. BRX10-3]
MKFEDVIDLKSNQITDPTYIQKCKEILERDGAIVIDKFITAQALEQVRLEGEAKKGLAFFTNQQHNVYISDADPSYPEDHVRNQSVTSSKGCITDDQIGSDSVLRTLYDSELFRSFLKIVLNEKELHSYADECSSINLHYASEGQELGWHFDNSSFATTLLIQKPKGGGEFQYVRDVRDADKGEMNFSGVEKVLKGHVTPNMLAIEPGALVLFRGRNAIHRVTPTMGDTTRMMVVLAYNNKPGVSLSASARKTFYGK